MDLAVFDFEDKVIRTSKTVDGEPLVCALDLARACGLKNPRDSYSRVSESYKVVGKSDTLGGDQKMVFFTEPGVYQFLLVLRPKKSSPMSVRVGRLQRWVFEEVLPTIRKTGSYTMATTPPVVTSDPVYDPEDELSVLLASHLRNRNEVLRVKREQEQQLGIIKQVKQVALEASAEATQAREIAEATEAQVVGRTGFKGALGFANLNKWKIQRKHLATIGKTLSRACRDRGLETKDIQDEHFGTVNSYPIEVLEDHRWLFEQFNGRL